MPRKPRFGRIYHPKKKRPDGIRTEICTWWVAYYHNGQQIRESSKSSRYSDAEGLLRKRLVEMETGTYSQGARKGTVAALLDKIGRASCRERV